MGTLIHTWLVPLGSGWMRIFIHVVRVSLGMVALFDCFFFGVTWALIVLFLVSHWAVFRLSIPSQSPLNPWQSPLNLLCLLEQLSYLVMTHLQRPRLEHYHHTCRSCTSVPLRQAGASAPLHEASSKDVVRSFVALSTSASTTDNAPTITKSPISDAYIRGVLLLHPLGISLSA